MTSQPDCLIIGGGVAGLWLLSRLRDAGADAWLLEKNQLGGGQTLASQGIIHGGIKYSLNRTISGSTRAIATMPERWSQHMLGRQIPQLKNLQLLSRQHFLITTANMRGRLARIVASKALVGNNTPASLESLRLEDKMTGIAIEENVIDTSSLIEQLHQSISYQCRQYSVSKQQIHKKRGKWSVEIEDQIITPRLLIFAAGEGNAEYIGTSRVQLRPLHMVYLRHKELFPIYAHFIEPGNSKPLCTISSHYDQQGELVWYLGGDLAETGVGLYSGQQCVRAEQLLRRLWTNIDWGYAQWKSFVINRAEYRTRNFMRPQLPDLYKCSKNAIAVFPTKLTFTPLLADMVINEYNTISSAETKDADSVLSKLNLAQPGYFPWSIH